MQQVCKNYKKPEQATAKMPVGQHWAGRLQQGPFVPAGVQREMERAALPALQSHAGSRAAGGGARSPCPMWSPSHLTAAPTIRLSQQGSAPAQLEGRTKG